MIFAVQRMAFWVRVAVFAVRRADRIRAALRRRRAKQAAA